MKSKKEKTAYYIVLGALPGFHYLVKGVNNKQKIKNLLIEWRSLSRESYGITEKTILEYLENRGYKAVPFNNV